MTPSCPADSRVDVSTWTIKNPDGRTPNMNFDILKRRKGDREHSSVAYVRSKLRCWDRPIDHVTPHRDLVGQQLLLPATASDMFLSADSLWTAVDAQTDWEGEPHLLAGPTIWFPAVKSQHWALRQAAAFALAELVDKYGVAAHLIAHAPGRIAHGADFHVHILCTARRVAGAGLSTFAHELLHDNCQTRCKVAWDNWWRANPEP